MSGDLSHAAQLRIVLVVRVNATFALFIVQFFARFHFEARRHLETVHGTAKVGDERHWNAPGRGRLLANVGQVVVGAVCRHARRAGNEPAADYQQPQRFHCRHQLPE